MVRSLNIKATDQLITREVFKIIFDQNRIHALLKQNFQQGNSSNENLDKDTEVKKLKNKQKRLEKELDSIIENIASVETAKILGTEKERIAKGILVNLRQALNETEAKIEQSKIRIDEFQNEKNILEMTRKVDFNPQRLNVDIDEKKIQSYLKTFVNRIDVSYDKDTSEHELVIRFKARLINDRKDVTVNLKKNRKSA